MTRHRLENDPVKHGELVRVTVEGVLEDCDEESGYVYVRGCAPGHEHLPWRFTFHWATEFERVES